MKLTRSPRPNASYRLETELWLPQPREEVFAYFADAFNLEEITPPWLNFHVTTPAPIAMHAGALIDYQLKLHGFPIRWRTLISVWQPPYRFVDEQLRGPYRIWHHEHTFEEVNGGTLVRDTVDYAVPGGPLVHWLLVRRDVQRIFEYREQILKQIFQPDAALAATSSA